LGMVNKMHNVLLVLRALHPPIVSCRTAMRVSLQLHKEQHQTTPSNSKTIE
jgi:hypothetical protein